MSVDILSKNSSLFKEVPSSESWVEIWADKVDKSLCSSVNWLETFEMSLPNDFKPSS